MVTSSLTYTIDPDLDRYQSGIERLSKSDGHKAYARALNRVIAMVKTQVVRATVKQSSIPRKIVHKTVKAETIDPGSSDPLQVMIWAKGAPVSLKHFRATQNSSGVKATIFGQRKNFPGAFIFAGTPKSGAFVAKGHVFQRVTSSSLPIQKQTGPAVPDQIVRDQAKDAFYQVINTKLPERVNHEVGRLFPK